MNNVYEVGAAVVYDVYGVCIVRDVKPMSFFSGQSKENYYVLSPLNNGASTYYVPVNKDKAQTKLRKPLSEAEIRELLSQAKKCECSWIENRQLRSESYRQIMERGVCPDLLALIRCLYNRKNELTEKGKTLSATDEGVFASAGKMVNEEFAYSLNIQAEDVGKYIQSFIENEDN